MKKLLPLVVLIILVLLGYYGYRLFIEPRIVKLAPLDKLPFYSVVYTYHIQSNNLTSFSVGSEVVRAQDLGKMFEDDMTAIKKSGFGGVKLNFHFKGDNYIEGRVALKAAQAGLYPIGTLMGEGTKPLDRAFTNLELKEWQKFIEDVVKNNKYIYFWEIWKEPDVDIHRYGGPEEFIDLLKVTAPIIKKENPNAKIIVTLGAFDKRGNKFSEDVLSLGGGDYFDILSFHPYAANPYIREDVFKDSIVSEKKMLTKYGNRWPLMMGEIGQPVSEVGEAEQARLAKMVFEEAASENIPITWFIYSDERLPKNAKIGDGTDWGLIRNDGSHRPVYEIVTNFIKNNVR